ncbi:MAG: HD domain-containing protein [Candidatus Micrarchaeota archaeon]|nr:HD domain-containing protein [Candidatus Micrarchaeota archaeon]
MNAKDLINIIFEWGQLRRIKHEGWRLLGVDHPDSVAEHSLRAAQIGYVLAKMEKYENPHEIVSMCVFHDMGECRLGDIHKIANRYVEADERRAVKEQLRNLDFSDELMSLWEQVEERNTIAGNIAKDADLLEMAFMARELQVRGYDIGEWLENTDKYLVTDSARLLLEDLKTANPLDWFKGLKHFGKMKKTG